MSETMNVTEAKARLSELVASVATTQEHVEITRNGEPAAVLIAHEERWPTSTTPNRGQRSLRGYRC